MCPFFALFQPFRRNPSFRLLNSFRKTTYKPRHLNAGDDATPVSLPPSLLPSPLLSSAPSLAVALPIPTADRWVRCFVER